MIVGLIGRSSGATTSSVNPELRQIGEEGGRGADRRFSTSVGICAIRPGNGWGKGKLRSAPSSSSGRLFKSRFRAQAAVGGGVAAGEVKGEAKSFYELLGIPPGGSAAEIKRAYKEMARRCHPDVCPTPERTEEYTRLFIEVQEAYETLSDPGRRARYDRDLAGGLNLAFSARRRPYRYNCDEVVVEEKSRWKNQWMDQLEGLKRKSSERHSRNDFSWGARMRRHREREPSPE